MFGALSPSRGLKEVFQSSDCVWKNHWVVSTHQTIIP